MPISKRLFLIAIHLWPTNQFPSANCEQAFSRMGWIVPSRRAGITANHVDKRLTLCNQLPQKRRLLDVCETRKIKRAKLEESLFSLLKIGL